jgi:small subunit ribosomal protein S9|tara:strand:+ start:990 stop:1388 length:399 start_codon:yes stop_codon:yes gene_type:complete
MKIVQTTGKRKTAIARAVITKGIGKIRINKIPLEVIEPELSRMKITEPLLLAGGLAEKVDINVNVRGGGIMGQAEAVRTAIGRGLIEYSKDSKLKATFSDYDKTLLKSDPRRKETKKFGGKGARSKKQKSYR